MRNTMTAICLLLGLAGLTATAESDGPPAADPGIVTDASAPRPAAARTRAAEALSLPGGDCSHPVTVGIPGSYADTTVSFPIQRVPVCVGTSSSAPGQWLQVFGTGTAITASLCSPATDYDSQLSVFCGDCDSFGSDCCYPNGTPGCVTPDCEAAVCAADTFCCDTEWDQICADEAFDLCGSLCANSLRCITSNDNFCGAQSEVSWCSQPSARYLVLVHGLGDSTGNYEITFSEDGVPCVADVQCLPTPCPGDTNSDKRVNVNDLNAVIVNWGTDGLGGLDPNTGQPILADITDNIGGPPDGIVNVNDLNAVIVNWGPCFFAPGNDECADKIDVTVTANLPESVPLDMVAATPSTFGETGGCGNCNVANATPGCSGPACEAVVCATDPFCCDTAWDGVCADEAIENCNCSAPVCTPPAKDVWFCLNYADDPAAGLGDLVVSTSIDVFLEVYDGCDCTGPPALKWCGPGLGGSDPITVSDGSQCCVRVLNYQNLPNALLVGELVASVSRPCGPGTGDCCDNNGTPGCEDTDCCEVVCATDPFCCDTTWDATCAEEAQTLCGFYCPQCGHPDAGDCCVANGSPYCVDAACCETVCLGDPFCCDTEWDATCAGAAIAACDVAVCGPCGNNASGDCCVSNGSAGCDDLVCCEAVCAIDPFCCDSTWDGACAGAAAIECAGLCP